MFFPIEAEEELLKLYRVSVNARSINICIEHYQRLKKYKLIKLKLSNILTELKNLSGNNFIYFENLNVKNKEKIIYTLELDKGKIYL